MVTRRDVGGRWIVALSVRGGRLQGDNHDAVAEATFCNSTRCLVVVCERTCCKSEKLVNQVSTRGSRRGQTDPSRPPYSFAPDANGLEPGRAGEATRHFVE